MSALNDQIRGSHYKAKGIQPVEFIHSNGLTFIEGNVIKYVWRWRDKGGVADLEKAKHYIEMLIELETGGPVKQRSSDCNCLTASNEDGLVHELHCQRIAYFR